MSNYMKWLSSSKFQIAVLAIGMMLMLVARYGLAPEAAAAKITEIALAYLGARVLEPVVEYVVAKINAKKNGGTP